MSSFMAGIGARTAVQSIGMVEDKKKQGWDNFLAGAGRVGGSFLMGLAGGLANYDPRNPYSSFAAGIQAATPGLQTALAVPSATAKAEFMREQERLGQLSEARTQEEIASGQAARATVMPGGEGLGNVGMQNIAAAIAPREQKQAEVYDFKVGMYPSVIQQDTTSAGRVRNILMGGRQ